jgi:peptidyl-prolyl cis-trans isomerase A (cyclophilin A)
MLKRFALGASLALALPLAAQDAAPPPATPESGGATTDIVLETAMGDIVVALETERAPVSAQNFLRYVDEGRLDGTVFYRVMKLDWGEQPNGLIQGGTQFDLERILPPIAHEPTNETGLKHRRGALSLARNEPGSATGDFSIMVGDQPGLDADPGNADPELRAGYAVFGYVTDGMDVVEAIHAAPIDPEKAEGWLKGQMLAEPVTTSRRAAPHPRGMANRKGPRG